MELNWKSRIKAAGGSAALATAVLLVTTMTPAAAAGAGVSTGHTNVAVSSQIIFPLCLKATATTITLTNVGTFTAGSELFEGTTEAVFSTPNDYWFSPVGLFSNDMCTMPAVVTGSLSVTKVAGMGTVTCASSTGGASYSRVNTSAEITTATGSASCTVGSTTADTVLTFAGSQQPCLSDFGVPNCELAPESEWVGTYTQAP